MPTPIQYRTPKLCRQMVKALDADASIRAISLALGCAQSTVHQAIRDGASPDALEHLRELADAYERHQARKEDAAQQAKTALEILSNLAKTLDSDTVIV